MVLKELLHPTVLNEKISLKHFFFYTLFRFLKNSFSNPGFCITKSTLGNGGSCKFPLHQLKQSDFISIVLGTKKNSRIQQFTTIKFPWNVFFFFLSFFFHFIIALFKLFKNFFCNTGFCITESTLGNGGSCKFPLHQLKQSDFISIVLGTKKNSCIQQFTTIKFPWSVFFLFKFFFHFIITLFKLFKNFFCNPGFWITKSTLGNGGSCKFPLHQLKTIGFHFHCPWY